LAHCRLVTRSTETDTDLKQWPPESVATKDEMTAAAHQDALPEAQPTMRMAGNRYLKTIHQTLEA
jgi:hypothetical protein